MHIVSKRFIMASLIYLLLGSGLGVSFFFVPDLSALRPVHMHFNLLGFMSMMIYGVLYHVLPRFLGRPLYSYMLAHWHFYLANIALVFMMIGMGGYYLSGEMGWFHTAGLFGALEFVSMLIFVGNIAATMRTPKSRERRT